MKIIFQCEHFHLREFRSDEVLQVIPKVARNCVLHSLFDIIKLSKQKLTLLINRYIFQIFLLLFLQQILFIKSKKNCYPVDIKMKSLIIIVKVIKKSKKK